jgi:hypothetical protein
MKETTHVASAFLADQRVGLEHTSDPVGPSSPKDFTLGFVEFVVAVRGSSVAGMFSRSSGVVSTDFGFAPVFLPGSRKILFQGLGPGRSRDPSHYESDFRLFSVDRDTREVREVLAIPGASIEAPAASSDGRKLVFMKTAFTSDLWMIDASPEGTSSEAPF